MDEVIRNQVDAAAAQSTFLANLLQYGTELFKLIDAIFDQGDDEVANVKRIEALLTEINSKIAPEDYSEVLTEIKNLIPTTPPTFAQLEEIKTLLDGNTPTYGQVEQIGNHTGAMEAHLNMIQPDVDNIKGSARESANSLDQIVRLIRGPLESTVLLTELTAQTVELGIISGATIEIAVEVALTATAAAAAAASAAAGVVVAETISLSANAIQANTLAGSLASERIATTQTALQATVSEVLANDLVLTGLTSEVAQASEDQVALLTQISDKISSSATDTTVIVNELVDLNTQTGYIVSRMVTPNLVNENHDETLAAILSFQLMQDQANKALLTQALESNEYLVTGPQSIVDAINSLRLSFSYVHFTSSMTKQVTAIKRTPFLAVESVVGTSSFTNFLIERGLSAADGKALRAFSMTARAWMAVRDSTDPQRVEEEIYPIPTTSSAFEYSPNHCQTYHVQAGVSVNQIAVYCDLKRRPGQVPNSNYQYFVSTTWEVSTV